MERGEFDRFTKATLMIESDHPAIHEFSRNITHGISSSVDRAVALYYAVRDQIRYDPYRIDLTIPGMKASTTLQQKRGWCVSKAVLLAACCRALDIPARLGFADVRNHMSTERLRSRMGTDIFYWHGYTEMFLATKWVKATPAFNVELCQKFGLLPLEFDGSTDSLYHPYDSLGNRHMEYINHRGAYPDVPLDEISQTFRREYSFAAPGNEPGTESFEEDAERENSASSGAQTS